MPNMEDFTLGKMSSEQSETFSLELSCCKERQTRPPSAQFYIPPTDAKKTADTIKMAIVKAQTNQTKIIMKTQ